MIEQMRKFNRTVTQRVGALDDAFLARGRPLGQARLLWEIGEDGADVRTLRSRLELDSGYLSRMLGSLQADGLISVSASPRDARVRMARLTDAGRAERAILDELSDAAAGAILEPLSPRQRQRLVAAMTEVERLLTASMISVARCDPRDAAARYCLRAYFSELDLRFETGFDPAHSNTAGDGELTPPAGVLLVATLHEQPVGCGAVRLQAGQPAEIKRMWVAPSVRGLGLGRRILAELENEARAAGARSARLETNGVLREAIALYRSSGYREIRAFSDDPYAEHSFSKPLG